MATRDELEQRAADVFDWMTRGRLAVRIDRTFALSEAAEAHHYIEGRKTQGKLLLVPESDRTESGQEEQ